MLVCLRSTGTPFFWESTSGNAVLVAPWFDSGCVDVSLRRLLYEFTFSTFGYSDPSIDSFFLRGWKLCFRILRNAWSSVVHALRPSRSLLTRFTHFLREGGRGRPVRAWNVDIISRPLYLAVNCSVSLASEHTYADFWEMNFRNCSRILRSLVRQWMHVWRQSMRFFGRISHVFYVKVDSRR